jgi:hypothetical protein
MAVNCYEYDIPIEVCVDGPVGGGDTAEMTVFLTSGGSTPVTFDSPAGTVSDWDGSPVVFTNFVNDNIGSTCDWGPGSLTVALVGDNEVEVTIELVASNCGSTGSIYSSCGDDGPHTFTDTKIVPMSGVPCGGGLPS